MELSKAEPADIREAIAVVRTLLRVNAEQDAVRLLLRVAEHVPTDHWSQRSDAFDLLCRLRPSEGRRVLLGLARTGGLVGGEVLNAARNLLRLGENEAAITLADELLARQDPEVRDVVGAARLVGEAGDMERTIAACELALRVAARPARADGGWTAPPDLTETAHAAEFLHSVGRLDAQQSALLVAAATTVVKPGMTVHDKRRVLRAAELIATAGGTAHAARTLG